MLLPGIRLYLSTLILFSLACYLPALSSEGEPPEPILTLIASALVNPSPPEEQSYRASVIKVLDDYLDWEEITRQALGEKWRQAGEKERKRLVSAGRALILGTRLGHPKASSLPARTAAKSWTRRRPGGVVSTTIVLAASSERTPITYCLRQKGPAWRIVDIRLPGTSLVEHCREHFRTLPMIT